MGQAGSSKTAPRILFFSFTMGADYLFELISIVTYAPQFIGHNELFLGSVFGLYQNNFAIDRIAKFIDYCTKKETTLRVGHFTTTSGHFSANCINIFHKTGDQRNILRCVTCLNLNWIKSYDINTILFIS
jgi:hypothetical protein